jgi:hypothetical protein
MSAESKTQLFSMDRRFEEPMKESLLENSELRDLFMKDESGFVKKGKV